MQQDKPILTFMREPITYPRISSWCHWCQNLTAIEIVSVEDSQIGMNTSKSMIPVPTKTVAIQTNLFFLQLKILTQGITSHCSII